MTTTAIPRTARTLAALDPVALTDASLLLARTGSTDGSATLAALRTAILGPTVEACIYQPGAAHTVTISAIDTWTAATPTTTAAAMEGATSDGAGAITVGHAGRYVAAIDVLVTDGGATDARVGIIINGTIAPQSASAPKRVSSTGIGVDRVCLLDLDAGDVVVAAVLNATSASNLDVSGLALTLHRLPGPVVP
jgi:hypothetical protein